MVPGRWRRSLPVGCGVVLAILGLGSTAALAATAEAHRAQRQVYSAGTYFGKVKQNAPKPYAGRIHFVVRKGRITDLAFTLRTRCGESLWSIERENKTLRSLVVKVQPSGRFSFHRTIKERVLKFGGVLSGRTAHGTLFESFTTGVLPCSTGQPASFTASR